MLAEAFTRHHHNRHYHRYLRCRTFEPLYPSACIIYDDFVLRPPEDHIGWVSTSYSLFCRSVSSITGKGATIITTRRFWSHCMGNQLLASEQRHFPIQYPTEKGFPCAVICARALGVTRHGIRVQPVRLSKEPGFLLVDSSLGRTAPALLCTMVLGHVCSLGGKECSSVTPCGL
ncbi:hypothetical protein LZ30DRAFT_26995 [Colletotrichum cereale]|nr:hypothetical protein LZ30DRAFT_26995 [Colletotrichum cereale]